MRDIIFYGRECFSVQVCYGCHGSTLVEAARILHTTFIVIVTGLAIVESAQHYRVCNTALGCERSSQVP